MSKYSKVVITSRAEVILHQSNNPWKPQYKFKKETVESNPEVLKYEGLKRNVQSVLNKLTFQKFNVLLEALKLNIPSEREIKLVAHLIYEHAIYEPKFSCIYATLCKHLDTLQIEKPNASLDEEQVRCSQVVSIVLTKCDKEFEDLNKKDEYNNVDISSNEASCKCEKESRKLRFRRLGNIRFIGELFKLHMISRPMLQEYIKRLITIQDEQSLECLFILMKMSGKEIDNGGTSKQIIQACFTQIQDFVDKGVISTRIRCLLQDILDLRNNNWVPRKVEITPKTIDAIHEEIAWEIQNQLIAKENKTAKRHSKRNKKATTDENTLVRNESPNSSGEIACYSKETTHSSQTSSGKNTLEQRDSPSSCLSTSIQLHQCENAWKPLSKFTEASAVTTEIWEQEKLKRNVQCILNKLTFQKFKILLSQLKLYISSGKEVDLVVSLIYENSIYEPRFCALFATLCLQLQKIKVPVPNSEQQINFSEVMSNKCQNEFNKLCNVSKKDDCKDVIGSPNKEQILFEKEMQKLKARRIGNVRFIGELFNVKMFPRLILEKCIGVLLSLNDEESLECLCWLLKTSNKQLESEVATEKQLIEVCFSTLQNIVKKQTTSTRIRCLLQDVLDLKNNKWIPKRMENVPRTIDEIHEEASLETSIVSKLYQNKLAARKIRKRQKQAIAGEKE